MPLSNKRILVAEDVYLLADDIARALSHAGAIIIGPFATCAETLRAIMSQKIDAAVLDIGLQDSLVFPCARELRRLRVPYLFVTGYSHHVIPDEFARDICVTKPVCDRSLVQQLCALFTFQKLAPRGHEQWSANAGDKRLTH